MYEYPVTLTVAKLESAGSRFWGGGFVRGWRGHRRGRRPAAHSANMQATQAAGLDEMSVEEKAVEIARLRKQTAAASQRLDQANQQAALLDLECGWHCSEQSLPFPNLAWQPIR